MRRRLLLVAVLALSLVAPTSVPALQLDLSLAPGGTGEASFLASPNMEHVVNLPHKRVEADGSLGPVTGAQNGTDIEFVTIDGRDYALAGSYQHGLQIVDITDPADPVTVSVYDCGISQGDVQVFTREDRTYVAYTADNGYEVRGNSACLLAAQALGLQERRGNKFGTYIADITDPTSPVTVSFYGNPQGSHNQTVAPGGLYLYNSNSDIGIVDGRDDPLDQTGRIEVVDISDFSNPTEVAIVPLLTGADSHDITFNADGTRAYTAALTHTLVLDTTDLANPEVIGRIIDPTINIHHQSDPVTLTDPLTGLEHTLLVVTDELAGAAGNGVCPGGGLHIYDVTGDLERAPVKVGYWNMPSVRPAVDNLTCTSHVLRLHPDEAIMTIAWYDAGVRVVDISGLIGVSVGVADTVGNVGPGMQEIGFFSFDNSDTWSAKTPRIEEDGSFYLFGNDMSRGLDVYRFQGDAPVAAEGGTWLSGAGLLTLPRAVTTSQATRCLLK